MEENKELAVSQPISEEQDNKVLDKYLAKKSLNKKITISFILGVSLLLVGVILFLSLYQVSVKPFFLLENQPRAYETVIDGHTNYYGSSSDEFDDITATFNKTFTMSLLSAIFTGQTGDYQIKETLTRFQSGNISSYLGRSDYIRVEFEYNQKLMASDKTEYISDYSRQAVTYTEFYLALPEGNALQEIKVVIPVYGNYRPSGSDSFSDTISTVTTITVQANINSFREFLTEL